MPNYFGFYGKGTGWSQGGAWHGRLNVDLSLGASLEGY